MLIAQADTAPAHETGRPASPPESAAQPAVLAGPAVIAGPAIVERPVVAGEAIMEGPELVVPQGDAPFSHPSPFDEQGSIIDQQTATAGGFGMEYLPPAAGAGIPPGCAVLEQSLQWALRNLHLFAGVHGFKGPTDLGLSGNFGFHEGLNMGAPLGDPWGYGYQVGFQALHSNFAGNQPVQAGLLPNFETADRNQVFLTAGIFQRPQAGGIQGGVVFDLFYDNYYDKSMLYQIRSETALLLGDLREIGYWGAYGISKDSIRGLGQFDTVLRPTDLFAVFYRRRFTGGGLGRLWAGVSGNGDAIFGLDGTVPLGTHWALDNNFTCLFPKNGRSADGRPEESWSVSIQLVWFPGRPSRPVVGNPYHPLFYVADNSWFLVDRRQ